MDRSTPKIPKDRTLGTFGKADHTDPDQHGIEPATSHFNSRVLAAVGAALAGIDLSRWARLGEKLFPLVEKAAIRAAEETITAVGGTLTLALEQQIAEWARTFARDRAAELVGMRWVGGRAMPVTDAEHSLAASSLRMITGAVRDAIISNATVDTVREILERSPAFSPARAERIATYEARNLVHKATMFAFKQSNRVRGSYWRTMEDDAVEEICDDNKDASPVPLGQPFPSGDFEPMAHVACFPGGTTVSAAAIKAVTRRLYDGDLVVIRTAAGNELSCTPNHPILTPSGWLAAHFLNKGDDIISRHRSQRKPLGIDEDHQDVPPRIEDVAEAFRIAPGVIAVKVPTTARDFHGDGKGSKIAIIWSDSVLRDSANPAVDQHIEQLFFERRLSAATHLGACEQDALLSGPFSPSCCVVSGGSLNVPLLVGHHRPLDGFSLASASRLDSSLDQSLASPTRRKSFPLSGARPCASLRENFDMRDPMMHICPALVPGFLVRAAGRVERHVGAT